MRLLLRSAVASMAVVLALGAVAPARAAVLWTLTASPLAVTTGTATTFSLRASLTLLGEIRCVEVDVPANFTVAGATVTGSNAGSSWTAQLAGNTVRVFAASGGDRLRSIGHYVDFTISATAMSSGSLAWGSHSHDKQDCTGGSSLLSVPPIVLVTGPAVTPTPTPTPVPTPTPTVAPTPKPTPPPVAPAPSQAPAAPSKPEPDAPTSPSRPTTPADRGPVAPVSSPSSAPSASATAAPSPDGSRSVEPSPSPSAGDAGTVLPGLRVDGPPPSDRGGPPGGRILAEPDNAADEAGSSAVPVSLGALGWLGSVDVWIVPGVLLGVPGLLVIAFVLLQAVGAAAWIPAIRRLERGEEGRPAVA